MKLKIDNLVKKYDNKIILNEMSMDIQDVQVLALIGASGSGKSTLLRLIAGLETFESGDIAINDDWMSREDIRDYRKKVGFVFQDHNLFSHLSIFENISLILEKVHGQKRTVFTSEILSLLTYFGLEEHKDKLPHQISGGQSQRASIARALAIKPEIILLDEPTSSLDPVLTWEVLYAIKKLVDEKKDVILVTHEIGFVKHVADYVIFLDEGQVIEQGRDILSNPKTEALQAFLGKVLSFA
ncbi:MAG: ATP-binding cassette domain-containing protein [Vallitaleaceae bacterium]|nr:ATP-binding cassette domain-containing protein [Vallitaleaceae bacterium]